MDEKVDFQPVYTTFAAGKVAFIKSLFDSHSVNYYVDNVISAAIGFGNLTGEMTFMVAKDQVNLAKELLKKIA